jgi:hypothetical protein
VSDDVERSKEGPAYHVAHRGHECCSECGRGFWPVEWESAAYLADIGITPNTLRAGDKVIITGNITCTNAIALISVQRPSQQDNQPAFAWGYLGSIRAALSNGEMFVGSASQ